MLPNVLYSNAKRTGDAFHGVDDESVPTMWRSRRSWAGG